MHLQIVRRLYKFVGIIMIIIIIYNIIITILQSFPHQLYIAIAFGVQ